MFRRIIGVDLSGPVKLVAVTVNNTPTTVVLDEERNRTTVECFRRLNKDELSAVYDLVGASDLDYKKPISVRRFKVAHSV